MMPLDRILEINVSEVSSERGANPQPRGLREKIWKTSHPAFFARSTARSRDPAIETWTPTFTIRETPSYLSPDQHSYREDIWRFVFRNIQADAVYSTMISIIPYSWDESSSFQQINKLPEIR
jgi:hypothetical protein